MVAGASIPSIRLPGPEAAGQHGRAAGDGQPVRRHGRAAADAHQASLVLATQRTDHTAPVAAITAPALARTITPKGRGHDHRHGRRCRRQRRRRRGLDRRRRDLASRRAGTTSWSYSWFVRAAARIRSRPAPSMTASICRRLRQRWRFRSVARPGNLQLVHRRQHPGHHQCQRRPAARSRDEVHVVGGRVRSRPSNSTAAPATPAPTCSICGPRPAPSWPAPPSPTRRPAAGRRSTLQPRSRSPPTRPTSRPTTPTGAYVATDNYFTTAVTNGPLTAPSTASCRRQRRLRLWRHQHGRHLPDQHLQRHQLLGRRGVRTERRPQHAADGGGGYGRRHRERRRHQRHRRLARDRQRADQRHRSGCRRHQDGDAVSFGATAGTLGAALDRRAWQPGAQRLGRVHLYRQRDRSRRAGAAAVDQHDDRRLQLHDARHRRRHLVGDAHDHHPRRQRRAGAGGPDGDSERHRRLGLLPGAARRHVHRRR